MFEKNPPFKIEDAFYQKWAAGIQEGGSGIHISIKLKDLDPNVVVQNIYFREHILEAKNSLQALNNFSAHLINNTNKTTIVMDINPVKEAENTPSNEFPFELDQNEAVISYWFEGERNYFKVHNLTEKREIAYPQAPSNK